MSSCVTPLSAQHFNKIDEQRLIKQLCHQYDVISVVKDYNISSVRKTELFLLGAAFSTEVIRGAEFKVMIMNKVMYILELGDDSWVN